MLGIVVMLLGHLLTLSLVHGLLDLSRLVSMILTPSLFLFAGVPQWLTVDHVLRGEVMCCTSVSTTFTHLRAHAVSKLATSNFL